MIQKAKKKPVEIEFCIFTGNNIEELISWSNNKVQRVLNKPNMMVDTLEGYMQVNIGDHIIKSINGEFYPCKPDIFLMTYDKGALVVPDGYCTICGEKMPEGEEMFKYHGYSCDCPTKDKKNE